MKLALLITFCALFPLTHIVLSHGAIRAGLIAKLSRWPFRGLYSLIAIFTLGGAVELFRTNRQIGPLLWELPHWLALGISLALMFLAIQLLLLSIATPSPAGMMPAKKEVRGVLRITRHPMNMAFALFALAHMMVNGHLGDLSFFASFFVLGLFGSFHQDRRMTRERSERYTAFKKQTSVLPFVAILMRRTSFEPSELSFPMVLVGLAAFAGVVFYHGRIFGVNLF